MVKLDSVLTHLLPPAMRFILFQLALECFDSKTYSFCDCSEFKKVISMFGLFKKKAPLGSFMLVAVKSALLLRAAEKDSGGAYTDPDTLKKTTDAIALQMNVQISGNLREVTHTCVMAFLMDQKFLDRLLVRAMNGPIGTFTQEDENEIMRITSKVTGVS